MRSTPRKSDAPFVPIYAGETIVGRAYQTDDKRWSARMDDGTPLGLHAVLIDAQAAILARHHAPDQRRPVNVSDQPIP